MAGSLRALAKGVLGFFYRMLPVAICVGLIGLFSFSVRGSLIADSSLCIEEIVVEPPQALSIAERQQLETSLIGKNIFKADLQRISARLERNSDVASARVVRRLPSRLEIFISPRKPFACLRFPPEGSLGVVSEDGTIMAVGRNLDSSLPLLEAIGTGIREPDVGMKIKDSGFREAVDFLKGFKQQPMAREETLDKVSFDSLGNVTASLNGGPQLRLGRRPLERLDSLEKIRTLLRSEERKQMEYIDLQFGNVIVKRKR